MHAPEPAEPWDGIYNAQQLGASCQVEEDCLYLNVATPKLPSDGTLLPTIVYIHGGSFLAGSGGGFIEWSDYYLQNDIVFVSINYRLGPLGFLSTGDSVVPGNNGLKDQNFALRWVKQNIAQFGGDPSRITICGLSAGGASIHYQLLSPLSKGLFQGAIAESGSALNPWSFDETSTARSRTLRYGQALLANTNDSQTLVDYLRTLSFQELLDGVQITMTELVFLNPEKFEYYNNNFDLVLPRNLALDKNTSLQVAEVVKKFYFGDKKLSQETLIQYINFS
ncbi:Esterase FE4 [Blattella germanica]|nr:Esterase FE4 [Blattella germanica]